MITFLSTIVTQYLCFLVLKFPGTYLPQYSIYILQYLYFMVLKCSLMLNVPQYHRYPIIKFPSTYVPWYFRSPVCTFPTNISQYLKLLVPTFLSNYGFWYFPSSLILVFSNIYSMFPGSYVPLYLFPNTSPVLCLQIFYTPQYPYFPTVCIFSGTNVPWFIQSRFLCFPLFSQSHKTCLVIPSNVFKINGKILN